MGLRGMRGVDFEKVVILQQMILRKNKTTNKEIFRLALPAIASNVTVPLLGLSDTAISGHLGEELYLAAIAAGSMMLNVVFMLCGFLRMATTGLTAEAYGRGSKADCGLVLARAGVIAFAAGCFILAIQSPLEQLLARIIDPPGASADLTASYFRICVYGVPALLLTLSINGWFVGMQNTVNAMVVSIGTNVVNIAASLTLVFVFDLGFVGVAYGTLGANWFGLILAMILLFRLVRKETIPFTGGVRAILKGGIGRFFKISGDLFVRSFCIMAVTLVVTSLGARMGELTLATNAVMMQFFMLFSYFMDGFAFSAEALCGKWHGARNEDMLKQTIKALLLWGCCLGGVFSLLYAMEVNNIGALITNVADVRDYLREMSFYVVLIPLASFLAFVLDGVFIGLTKTRRMLATTLAATAAFASVLAVFGFDSNNVLWIAFLSYLFVRGVGLFLQLHKVYKVA